MCYIGNVELMHHALISFLKSSDPVTFHPIRYGIWCIKISIINFVNNFTNNHGGGILMKKIKILAQTFDIIEKPVIELGQPLLGQVDHVKNKIYLFSELPNERKKVVLIHEILHSIFEQLGFNDEHDNEHLIDCLATSLYQVVKDNDLI